MVNLFTKAVTVKDVGLGNATLKLLGKYFMTAIILHCFSIKKKVASGSFLYCREPIFVVPHDLIITLCKLLKQNCPSVGVNVWQAHVKIARKPGEYHIQ